MVITRVASSFKRQSKALIKKYPSLKEEIEVLLDNLEKKPNTGVLIGNFVSFEAYKIRIAIKSKGKGKSSGARVITLVLLNTIGEDTYLWLAAIYDKSDKSRISDTELLLLAKELTNEWE